MASEHLRREEQSLAPHAVDWGTTPASALQTGARRIEAEAYLSDGFGRRVAIEARSSGWTRLGEHTFIRQPGRLKGILVAPSHGVPFLAAGQVFETRPAARKWLSLKNIPDAGERFVSPGTILVSRSGVVGRVVVAHRPHDGKLITDDLLRVTPKSDKAFGWLYAYLRTETFRSIMTGAHYGHVIKHIEVGQLADMPLISVAPAVEAAFDDAVRSIYAKRDRAFDLILEAEAEYSAALNLDPSTISLDKPYSVRAQDLFDGRRRLDGMHHNRASSAIVDAQRKRATNVESLGVVAQRVWWPNRFSRVFGENGTPYLSAEDLFDLNRPSKKRVYAGLIGNKDDYFLDASWIVMARSGQVYGLNGSVRLVGQRLTKFLISEDLIRIAPDTNRIRPGFLLTALGHPSLGRPLVIRHAYGTSIPHLEPADVVKIPVPRFSEKVENSIADRVEEAATLRAEADEMEDETTARAESIIVAFLRGVTAVK